MKWIAATVGREANVSSADSVVEILADLFYGLGLKGVVVNEARPADDNRVFVSVTGYFPDNAFLMENRSLLETAAGSLKKEESDRIVVTYEEIDEEDWADSWKAHFHPQRIGRRFVVKPTWRKYRHKSGDRILEIDPGMAFGTGTHATTRMCLIMLERYFKPDMTLLDVGTGTGILMIAAFRMGAAEVMGVDNDPLAVDIAGANLALNRVPSDRAGVLSADLVAGLGKTFDMVCANILAEVVITLIPDLKKVLAPDGLFICSGITESKAAAVEKQLRQYGFRTVDRLTEESWVCLAAVTEKNRNQ